MAASDYYLCDLCGSKAFYDAVLAYDNNNENPDTRHPWPDYVGYMMALCSKCAKTHKVEIVRR